MNHINPKILVGCPTSEHKGYCLDKYLQGIKELTYDNFDFLLVDNSKTDDYYNKLKEKGVNVIREKYYELARERVAKSRNILREKCLNGDYDYFFSLEQDILPPKDVIERLLKHKKEIISGVYYNYFTSKYPPGIKPLLWRTATKEELSLILKSDDPMFNVIRKRIIDNEITDSSRIRARFTCEELEKHRLIEIFMAGLGCVLIHRRVLEKIEFKGTKEREAFDDVLFFEDARKLGYKLYADTSVKCKHFIMNWADIKM